MKRLSMAKFTDREGMVWWGQIHRMVVTNSWGRQQVGMELLVKGLGRWRFRKWVVGTLAAQQYQRT